jgi:hypothetical protein
MFGGGAIADRLQNPADSFAERLQPAEGRSGIPRADGASLSRRFGYNHGVHQPKFSSEQVPLLEVVYDGFSQAATWPTTSYVDVVLDREHGLDFDEVVRGMPAGVVFADPGYTDGSHVRVTVAGLRVVEAAAADLERFVTLVRFAAERERSCRPRPDRAGDSSIDSDEAHEIWGVSLEPQALARLLQIVQQEGLYSGSTGPEPETGRWTLNVDRQIRRYRGLRDVEDYLERRPDPALPAWAPPPATDPYVFVLMPFEEPWSENVKDAIEQACARAGDQFAGLHWERADDITLPGKITDQIISAIQRADVLIADVTGSNPNVLFELGYADALRKEIIVINQVLERTPFDIKDWRQVRYATSDLGALRGSLVDFLTGVLRVAGFEPPRSVAR